VSEATALALALVFVAGVAAGGWVAYRLGRRASTFEAEARARRAALAGSRNALKGRVSEQFAPFLDGFDYDPADARFIGSPVDFVVFDGLSAGQVRQVVLVEVKTGVAKLTPMQRDIRDGVEAGEVSLAWHEVRGP